MAKAHKKSRTSSIQDFFVDLRQKQCKSIDRNSFDELRWILLDEMDVLVAPKEENPLSPMEAVTVALAASLQTNEIADITMNSPNTIKSLMNRAKVKLNVETKGMLLLEAVRQGIIELEDGDK